MESENIKGLNVKKLSNSLIAVELILFFLSVIVSFQVYESHESVDKITDEYNYIQNRISTIQTHSDYLSSMARQYVMTQETIFAIEYANEMKNCSVGIEDSIEHSSFGKDAMEHIGEAKDISEELHKRERYAMALVSYENLDPNLPLVIKEYEISEEDKNLSYEERFKKSDSLIFGDGYGNEKDLLREKIAYASEDLNGGLTSYKAERSLMYRIAFGGLMALLVASLLIFNVIVYCLFKYVLRPLEASIKAIQEDKKIPFSNSYELNYLASTYNEVFEDNVNTRLHLKSKAERDELTGLLNRGAFNSLTDFYANSNESIAFMIIDVDYFKTVNDTYGHQVGDVALQKVATLLKKSFRSDDFIIRYGGDEFCVIMTELDIEGHRGIIERKLNYINEILQNPTEENIPKLSISVGVAFSKSGFNNVLFELADGALYKTKENGRGSFTFAN